MESVLLGLTVALVIVAMDPLMLMGLTPYGPHTDEMAPLFTADGTTFWHIWFGIGGFMRLAILLQTVVVIVVGFIRMIPLIIPLLLVGLSMAYANWEELHPFIINGMNAHTGVRL